VNLIPIYSPSFLEPELLAARPDWQMIFGNDNPLALEIGCGMGDFMAKLAALHPEWNFIALDYYNKGCLKTCKRIDSLGLANVRVVRDEARSFIARCIPAGSLQSVVINCPDPWPKMRHRKRRLVQADFVRFLADYMQPGSDFHFATDFDDYGRDVADLMPDIAGFENVLEPDFYRHEREQYPLSKYMLKFIKEGKQIYFVHYRKMP
jgi:tRNA (guanine-N7-)-methyltransferase